MKLKDRSRIIFNYISYPAVIAISLICLFPFVVIISSSLTSEKSIITYGYNLIPNIFSIDAYKTLFEYPQSVINAYGITVYTTLTGALAGLFITAMTSFVLSVRRFKWARKFSFFFYFTTLFSGGLVPWYILCQKYLRFSELPLIALVAPYLISVFNLIIVRTFISNTIPESVIESARIDGAGYFRIFLKLILPLTKPVLATIGLFIALTYWNDWFLSYIFVRNEHFYTLQFYLYRMIALQDAMSKLAASANIDIKDMPKESIKMAMTVVAAGPILMVYPFVQKYFVSGLTIGSVKG